MWKLMFVTNNRSDIHFWKSGRIGPLIVESDCILGHEASGVVLKLGEGVRDLAVGEYFFLFGGFCSPPCLRFRRKLQATGLQVGCSRKDRGERK